MRYAVKDDNIFIFIVERRAFLSKKVSTVTADSLTSLDCPSRTDKKEKKAYMYPLFSEFFPVLDFDFLRHLLWCTSVDVLVIFFGYFCREITSLLV